MQATPEKLPQPVLAIAALGLLEAGVIAVYGAVLLFVSLTSANLGIMSALMIGGFFILVGLVIAFAVRMLVQGKSSGRSLLLVWQLFIIIIGVQTALAGPMLLGIPAVVISGAITILLFSSSVTQHLLEEATRR